VLYQDDGRPLTEKTVKRLVLRAARPAGLKNNGPTPFAKPSALAWRCVREI